MSQITEMEKSPLPTDPLMDLSYRFSDKVDQTIDPLSAMDKKLREGHAIKFNCGGTEFDDTLVSVSLRLARAFKSIRQDESTEHGASIAYSIVPLADTQIASIDEALARVARRQNHGMNSLRLDDTSDANNAIWLGEDRRAGRQFKLIRHFGMVALYNGDIIPDSFSWTLLSRRTR